MDLFLWREKRLRTVWRVEKDGNTIFLVGTAHFFPYSFKKSLTRLIQMGDIILFEGPLDKESMERVVEYGKKGEGSPSINEALEPSAIRKINHQLQSKLKPSTILANSYINLLYFQRPDPFEVLTKGVKPWLAFFTIWSTFLNWKYSMDVEAFKIAQRLGKRIQYLETIEDQLSALDSIPFERFVNFLNNVDKWAYYKKMFLHTFLSGDLDRFASMTEEFPTRCESIIAKRDPIFFNRIKEFSKKGRVVAFIGVIHLLGIRRDFLEEGYVVTQGEA